jgi:hypothetical protein
MIHFRSSTAQSAPRLCHCFLTHSFITAVSHICRSLTEDVVNHKHVMAHLYFTRASTVFTLTASKPSPTSACDARSPSLPRWFDSTMAVSQTGERFTCRYYHLYHDMLLEYHNLTPPTTTTYQRPLSTFALYLGFRTNYEQLCKTVLPLSQSPTPALLAIETAEKQWRRSGSRYQPMRTATERQDGQTRWKTCPRPIVQTTTNVTCGFSTMFSADRTSREALEALALFNTKASVTMCTTCLAVSLQTALSTVYGCSPDRKKRTSRKELLRYLSNTLPATWLSSTTKGRLARRAKTTHGNSA